jgi:hypothetical protein
MHAPPILRTRWTALEKHMFEEATASGACKPRDWRAIAGYIGTRDPSQVRGYAKRRREGGPSDGASSAAGQIAPAAAAAAAAVAQQADDVFVANEIVQCLACNKNMMAPVRCAGLCCANCNSAIYPYHRRRAGSSAARLGASAASSTNALHPLHGPTAQQQLLLQQQQQQQQQHRAPSVTLGRGKTPGALPVSIIMRLLQDDNFCPGARPMRWDDERSDRQWVFKETVRAVRRGSDTWMNSGGIRGARDLFDGDDTVGTRRRYGKIVRFKSKNGQAAVNDRSSFELLGRYHEYSLIVTNAVGGVQEDRETRVYHITPPPDNVPRLGLPPVVTLSAREAKELEAAVKDTEEAARGAVAAASASSLASMPLDYPHHYQDGDAVGASPTTHSLSAAEL